MAVPFRWVIRRAKIGNPHSPAITSPAPDPRSAVLGQGWPQAIAQRREVPLTQGGRPRTMRGREERTGSRTGPRPSPAGPADRRWLVEGTRAARAWAPAARLTAPPSRRGRCPVRVGLPRPRRAARGALISVQANSATSRQPQPQPVLSRLMLDARPT
jgi:hypothetical protein